MGYIAKTTLLFSILRVTMSTTSLHFPKKSYIDRDIHSYVSTWHQTDMKANIIRIIDLLDLLLGDLVSNTIVQNYQSRSHILKYVQLVFLNNLP